LQVTGQPSPTTTAKRAELATQPLGSKPEELRQHLTPFLIDGAEGLEHHRREQERLALETGIILSMLLKCGVRLTGTVETYIRPDEWAGDSHVDRKTFATTPDRNSHISRTTTRGRTQNALLLHDGAQQTIRSHTIDEVT
jgi:hypothetical protein